MKNLKKYLFIVLFSSFTISIYSQTESNINELCLKELNKDAKELQIKNDSKGLQISTYYSEINDGLNTKLRRNDPLYIKYFNDYKNGAQNNQPLEQFKLGLAYGNGLGTKVNCQEQLYWIQKAAENNYAEAQYTLSLLYNHELYQSKKGDFWLQKAAENNFAEAQCELAISHNWEKNTIKTIYWYEKAAENMDSYAAYKLGEIYKSQPDYIDLKKASYWYEKAAENRYFKKESVLKSMIDENYISKYPIMKGVDSISMSQRAERELVSRRLELSKMYTEGMFGKIDLEKAFYWQVKATEYDLNALKKLISMYQNGEGTKVDLEKAFHYTKLLATKTEEKEDYFNLGNLYLKGIGTEIDDEKACECFHKASDSFTVYAKADYSFGVCLLDGKFKEWLQYSDSRLEGLKRLKRAIGQNYPPAIKYYQEHSLEDLEKDLINQNEDYAKAERTEKDKQERDRISNENAIIPVDRSSFAKDLGNELNKTANTIKQQGEEYQAALRGTTVAEENAKVKRQAEFDAITAQNPNSNLSSNSSSGNISHENKSSNSNEPIETKLYTFTVNHIYSGIGKTETEACENAIKNGKETEGEKNVTNVGSCDCHFSKAWNDSVGNYLCKATISATMTSAINPAKPDISPSNTMSK